MFCVLLVNSYAAATIYDTNYTWEGVISVDPDDKLLYTSGDYTWTLNEDPVTQDPAYVTYGDLSDDLDTTSIGYVYAEAVTASLTIQTTQGAPANLGADDLKKWLAQMECK